MNYSWIIQGFNEIIQCCIRNKEIAIHNSLIVSCMDVRYYCVWHTSIKALEIFVLYDGEYPEWGSIPEFYDGYAFIQ